MATKTIIEKIPTAIALKKDSDETSQREAVRRYRDLIELRFAIDAEVRKQERYFKDFIHANGLGHGAEIGTKSEKVVYTTTKERLVFNQSAFKAAEPKLYEQYRTQVRKGSEELKFG